jgi:hypothetical protein
VASRLAETRAVAAAIRRAPWTRRLLGHGLGATFEAAVPGSGGRQNYLHNFYVFLAFKLGIVGGALVAGALALWMGSLVAWSRRAPAGAARRFLAASTGAWAGLLVLAVSSPEILNFRVAPVLGWLLAASAGARAASRRPA